jgi:nucleoside-triphosphatase THEP1
MTTIHSNASFAAAVYKPDTGDRMALMKFVEKQKTLNTRVGGVLQEIVFNSEGAPVGLNAVDVLTNRRIPITRPVQNIHDCSLDISALAETTNIIRNAINDRLDLVVVEKFGNSEQNGKGLIDEILQTLIEGIPLLISVPEMALPAWQERSGELGSVLPFTEEAFLHWWETLE